jgi:hypothetical protein
MCSLLCCLEPYLDLDLDLPPLLLLLLPQAIVQDDPPSARKAISAAEAGVYWIGALFESDITCFFATVPTGGNPPMGPGSADAYISCIDRAFASGLLAEWTPTVGGGGFTVYATTRT